MICIGILHDCHARLLPYLFNFQLETSSRKRRDNLQGLGGLVSLRTNECRALTLIPLLSDKLVRSHMRTPLKTFGNKNKKHVNSSSTQASSKPNPCGRDPVTCLIFQSLSFSETLNICRDGESRLNVADSSF